MVEFQYYYFGIITSSGLRMLVDEKVDLEDVKRNLVISLVIIVLGVGGAMLKFQKYALKNFPAMAAQLSQRCIIKNHSFQKEKIVN